MDDIQPFEETDSHSVTPSVNRILKENVRRGSKSYDHNSSWMKQREQEHQNRNHSLVLSDQVSEINTLDVGNDLQNELSAKTNLAVSGNNQFWGYQGSPTLKPSQSINETAYKQFQPLLQQSRKSVGSSKDGWLLSSADLPSNRKNVSSLLQQQEYQHKQDPLSSSVGNHFPREPTATIYNRMSEPNAPKKKAGVYESYGIVTLSSWERGTDEHKALKGSSMVSGIHTIYPNVPRTTHPTMTPKSSKKDFEVLELRDL